ncbi:hypothetical protein GGF46_000354 [Coemansia sp. RSA 552]|nr:hypothetical protein GGF46_000354 [Coemansia sp. RSA 552]
MVSVLMNLKGNIELNVGARLSTLAHVGALDWAAVRAQAALAAAQATGVGFVAGALAMVTGRGSHVAMLLATGGASALGGSGAMALLIGATVRVAHVCGVDPDNVATPVASSVGDASTLLAVGGLASALTRAPSSVATLAVCVVAVLAAVLGGVAVANRQTAGHVRGGWAALAYAAVTSGIAGVVVERSAGRFPALPALVPLVNGVTGNISTVFASRISTSLHRQAFVAADHRLAMAILLLISVPVQAAVLLAAHSFVSLPFLAAFAVATAIHGLSVLVLALAACRYLWNRGHDPDDCVNPLVTGTGDMLGTLLLAMVFTLVEA